MTSSLDELLNAEFKEAFDEFDKVLTQHSTLNTQSFDKGSKSKGGIKYYQLLLYKHSPLFVK